jgi:hypothetical protein
MASSITKLNTKIPPYRLSLTSTHVLSFTSTSVDPGNSITLQVLSRISMPMTPNPSNYYHHLPIPETTDNNINDLPNMSQSSIINTQSNVSTNKPSYFLADLAVSEVEKKVRAQVLQDNTNMEIKEGVESIPLIPTL